MLNGYNYGFYHEDDEKPKKKNYIKTKEIFVVGDKKIEKELKKIDDEKKKEVNKDVVKKHIDFKKKDIIKKDNKLNKIDKIDKVDDMSENQVQRAIKMRQKQGLY
jgi:phage terminase Nu1 subunit (DNA packaging protein)